MMFPHLKTYLVRSGLFSALAVACFVLPLSARSDASADLFPTVPEASWIGLRLVILPQSKALQHYGYQEIYRDTDPDKEYVPLRYDDYVGRIVRVTGIAQGHGKDGGQLDIADLQLEGDKKIIHGDIDQGCMTDVAPAADLEMARKLYLGKTMWLTSDHISTYDPQKDTSDVPTSSVWHDAFQKISVKQFSPVKILDVIPGWYASAPVRFIVQEEAGKGATGYIDVHMSDTNVPKMLQLVSRFQSTFLESDPRRKYPWTPKIWTALENREIFPGMTAQQVRMSWGEPKEIHKEAGQTDTEQWIYEPAQTLTFKAANLETISSQPISAKNLFQDAPPPPILGE